MPAGKTKAPWILTIESAHWVIDSGVPATVTNAITNAGYAAVHPLHRLAPPGKIAGQVGNGMYPQQNDDLEMAVAAAKRDPRCDGKVAAVGGSGGAYLAAWLEAKGLVFAAAALSPATYLPDIITGGGPPALKTANFCASPNLEVASPVNHLRKRASSPLMLIAYTNDQMPASQYSDEDVKLVAKGIDHTSVLIQGAGHSWSAWNSQQMAILHFINSRLPP